MTENLVPDLLLTDLMLPDVDGLDVARRVRRNAKTAGVRVILMTGYASDDLVRRAIDAGIDRAFIKPCLPQAMLREVRRVLRRGANK